MTNYISVSSLEREQNKLHLDLINYNLDEEWQSHVLISKIRKSLYDKMPQGNFDPQDLEHQVLFRLTTFSPDEINDELINTVINEQRLVIENRLKDVDDLSYLFRGLSGRSRDLNINHRLELKREGERLYATSDDCIFEIEFKKITDDKLINLFTEKLHYIHSSRHHGDAFGLFFRGDSVPWGIETVEPSITAKQYKRDALLAHGIDPNKAVEITRLYLLPGSPKNAISIIDGLVAKHYKSLGVEAMYTTTMPTYAKTRGATTSGGMNRVLLVKELSHKFYKERINGVICYIHSVNGCDDKTDVLKSHNLFPTLLTVETYMRLNQSHVISPLKVLDDKTIYINEARRNNSVSFEAKFIVNNLSELLPTIVDIGTYINTRYIYDTFWGFDEYPKLRLRKLLDNGSFSYEVSRKYRISEESHIRTTVNDTLYKGLSLDNATSEIKIQNVKYKKENSYEKIRIEYIIDSTEVRVEIYPFGCFIELEGDKNKIWGVARKLGYSKSDSITKHADDTYLRWNKKMGLKELWNVKFGLEGAERDIR
jgi:adenylate cyclase class IV